jgi:ADP-dependent NAD(P)H-hydrate dehydratase / NAD(P)H-hydrate epimerase
VTLPDWLDPVYEAAEMRAVDAWAIQEQGVPSLDLMERAGAGLARVAAETARPGWLRVVIGKAGNGGDGLVAARLLRADGHEVDVLTVAALDELRGDALVNLERLPGAAPEPFAPEGLDGSGVVVDALLGTGFEGVAREPVAGAIAAINAQDGPVVACDVPSGVDASTGELISERVLELYPRRARSGSKFDSGVVLVVGGSAGLTGAPTMAARSASRAGAGYVQVAVPESAQAAIDMRLLEQMSRGLPEHDGAHTPTGVPVAEEMAERAGAVVLGPGLGRDEGAAEFARAVAAGVGKPLLIDADGLNAHAGRLALLQPRTAPTVLTPHEGELARLLEVDSEEIKAHRLAHAREAAELSGAVVLLKGDDTIVAAPGGPVAINRGATPALATAGTGDVLSGLLGALLAKSLPAFEAAALGALAHALAGMAAAERHGADHVVAGDVIDALPYGLTLR